MRMKLSHRSGKRSTRASGLVKDWVQGTRVRLNETVRGIADEIAERVIEGTPVDTGHLVHNWQVGINVRPRAQLAGVDPGKSEVKARVKAQNQALSIEDKEWILANNVPYAVNAEYIGWKFTPPYMMVQKVVPQFAEIVRLVKGRLRRRR